MRDLQQLVLGMGHEEKLFFRSSWELKKKVIDTILRLLLADLRFICCRGKDALVAYKLVRHLEVVVLYQVSAKVLDGKLACKCLNNAYS